MFQLNIIIIGLISFGMAACGNKQTLNEQYINDLHAHRARLDSTFRHSDKSPLPQEALDSFGGIFYWDFNPKYRIEATILRTPDAEPFEMPTTTERRPMYRKFADAHFTLDGEKIVLELYQNLELIAKDGYADYLFLPFGDATSAAESYGGGRYMDLRIPEADALIIDFNYAYNPYCAYNHKYSCPIPPLVNLMSVPILAGAKDYGKH